MGWGWGSHGCRVWRRSGHRYLRVNHNPATLGVTTKGGLVCLRLLSGPQVSLLKQGTWTCPPAGSWRETSQPSASPLASPLPSRPASPSILRTTDLLPGNGADSPGSAAKPGTAAGGEGTSHTAATPSPSATASSKPGRSPRPRSAPGSRKGSADQLRALGAQLPNLRTLLQPHGSITRDGVNPAKLFGSSGKVKLPEFRRAFTKLYALPSCLATSFFHAANNGDLSTSLLTLANFEAFARQLPSSPAEVLVYVLRPGATGFGPADLKPFVEAILQTHPGLEFLADAPEFGPRYVETVVARIFYSVNVTRTDRITAREVRRSDLLEALHHLDAEPDINNVLQYVPNSAAHVCGSWLAACGRRPGDRRCRRGRGKGGLSCQLGPSICWRLWRVRGFQRACRQRQQATVPPRCRCQPLCMRLVVPAF